VAGDARPWTGQEGGDLGHGREATLDVVGGSFGMAGRWPTLGEATLIFAGLRRRALYRAGGGDLGDCVGKATLDMAGVRQPLMWQAGGASWT
jgi:hypothetical protein